MVGGGENSWKEMTVFLTHIFRLHQYYVEGERTPTQMEILHYEKDSDHHFYYCAKNDLAYFQDNLI